MGTEKNPSAVLYLSEVSDQIQGSEGYTLAPINRQLNVQTAGSLNSHQR